MKLYRNDDGNLHRAIARVYLKNAPWLDGPKAGVFKVTLEGRSTDIILAATALVERAGGLRAVIVDERTKWGLKAMRLVKGRKGLIHRRDGVTDRAA